MFGFKLDAPFNWWGKNLNQINDFHSEGFNQIRTEVIDTVFLASGIFGTLAFYGSVMRVIKEHFQPIFIFYVLLFVSVWGTYVFRKRLSLKFKAISFFVLFFLSGTFLNLSYGVVSGAMHFIFVSVVITLLYGWRLGALSIIITLIVRTVIAILYFKEVLIYDDSFTYYALSPPILLSTILGALFTASVIVFAINKFYRWLALSLNAATEKANELEKTNIALDKAKLLAEENDRLKTVFLANMSHEIRTPMNAIIGFASLLGKKKLAEEKRKYFSSLVQERSYDLLRIIEDILDISKIEIGELKIQNSETYLYELLIEIYEYYSLKISKSDKKDKLKLQLDVSDELRNIIISTDRQRLKQIINNLLENATKFTNAGEIYLACTIKEQAQLMFTVADTGIGISKIKQEIIFDRFRQADESVSARKYGGTGLGLSIIKGILDLMGGKIWVESEPQKGSVFYFTVPYIKTDMENNSREKDNYDSCKRCKGKKVLLVEDDKLNSKYICEVLNELKLNLIICYSGQETLEVLEKESDFDLILMDIRLPDISGFELIKKIKGMRIKAKIIAQTAYAGSNDAKACLEAGCDGYITKPVRPEVLIGKMNQILK